MHLNNLMELTTQDPDPYFFGSYNWYYTGGALETASIFDVEFLFYASGAKLNVFSKFQMWPLIVRISFANYSSFNDFRFSNAGIEQRSTSIRAFGQYKSNNL